jgi:hypothetical protein
LAWTAKIANFNFFKLQPPPPNTSQLTLPHHTKSAARSSDIIVHRTHHHRSSFSAVELLSWARQDISSAIRVNNIGTSIYALGW